ncbi:hypothetical protein SH584_04250 [Sphingomonas sp. LY29]|uniref:hypothetical protein n=1 Tax=Sphingomonas sp. LY29 TaxID=3095341 RepID=UPI002D76EA80|nr:hypothetical protein [Sphingomonas sp. LY29]WRP26652.1 hypothetical protein SH584_04250 [Sphingomonas sp. LY29]
MAIGLLASATAGLHFFIQEGLTVAAALWLAGGSIVTVIASLALIAIGFRKDGSGED